MKENYRIRAMAARDPRFAKIAIRLGYGTRDMVAERAEPVEPAVEPVAEPATPIEPIAADEDIADVRAEYERVVGRRAYYGWDIETLRQKIAEVEDAF